MSTPFRSVRRTFSRLFGWGGSEVDRQAIKALARTTVFGSLSRRVLRHVVEVMHFRDFEAGEQIYHEGDPGLGLYVVVKGRIGLSVESGETVHDLVPFDVFGVRSISKDHRRSETAIALAPSRLIGLFQPDLKLLEKRHPRTGFALTLALAEYLTDRNERLELALREQKTQAEIVALLHARPETRD
ncbi:MAG: cyclic nucleotide-binding domain-containing protein [Bacteroidota bacterium]